MASCLARAPRSPSTARLETVEANNRKLELDLKGKERRLADLEADAAKSMQNNRQITETFETLRGRLVASIRRNSSGEVAEMLPFLGAVFALGSMAYDVNDACQQLKGIHPVRAV